MPTPISPLILTHSITKFSMLGSVALLCAISCLNVFAQSSTATLDNSAWQVSATNKPKDAFRGIDSSIGTRWSSAQTQRPGQAFLIDFGKNETFNRIELDAGKSKFDYPRAYSVHVSDDGDNWGAAVASGRGDKALTEIEFVTQTARYVRVTQQGSDKKYWWSIHNLEVFNSTGVVIDQGPKALDRSLWRLSSSRAQADIAKLVDGNIASRWTTKQNQRSGQVVEIDLSKVVKANEVVMQTSGAGASSLDYPRELKVEVSTDGQVWRTVQRAAGDPDGTTNIDLNSADVRYLRLTQTGYDDFYWWSIHEINVYANSTTPTENIAPSVIFVQPVSGASFNEGEDLAVEVQAQDDDGSVASVDLYVNEELVRQSTAAPHQWGQPGTGIDPQLRALSPGSYELKAIATDNQGATGTLSTIVQFILDDETPIDDEDETAKEHRYQKTEGPDINPLKGWNSGWSDDRSEASVGFQYIKWKDFEPSNGNFDFAAVEDVIGRSGSRNRHFVLRLYCDWHGQNQTSRGCPDWMYSQVGVRRIRGDNGRYITDYNDPKYLDEAVQAIQALAGRYDNDPRVHSFQLGVLGYWGEWHTFGSRINGDSYQISEASERRILNAYRSAFSNAKLVARYPYRSILRDTTDIGFHNDFFRPNNGHSAEFDTAVAEGQRWKDGPIGGEIPPGLSSQDYDALYLTSQGREMVEKGQYSTMKPGSVASKHRAGHMELHRRMGYNFQIDNALFAENKSKSEVLGVSVELTNIGVAPLYYPWQTQFALLNNANKAVKIVNADRLDLTRQLPNDSFTLKSRLSLASVNSGDYKLAIRIIQPGADQQKPSPWKLNARNTYIQFANQMPVVDGVWDSKNELSGGWSVLGNVDVK